MDQPPVTQTRAPGRWRVWLSVVLILVGCLLVPIGWVSAHGRSILVDTDRFVAIYAPLADDPEVQKVVVQEVTAVIVDAADLHEVTSALIDSLEPGPVLRRSLEALQGPLVIGVANTIETVVEYVVRSDAFASVWAASLRVTHSQLNATLSGSSEALVSAREGLISFELGPIVAATRTTLIEQGFTLANRIPEIQHAIPIVTSKTMPMVQSIYRFVLAVGNWIMPLGGVLIGGGVLVASRRRITLVWAAVGLGVVMLAFLVGLGLIERMGLPMMTVLPSQLAQTVFNATTAPMRSTARIAALLSFLAAGAVWAIGPIMRTSRRTRAD